MMLSTRFVNEICIRNLVLLSKQQYCYAKSKFLLPIASAGSINLKSYSQIVYNKGPDQVLPASSFKTSEADGTVTIFRPDSGPSSSEPRSVHTMFKYAYDKYPDSPALVVKRDGQWKKWTYKQYYEETYVVAKALIKLGLERFHGVCIMGYNSPEWLISGYGAIFAGGLNTGIYTTNSPEACRMVAENCRAQIIIVEDQHCVNKFLEVKSRLPEIKAIIQWSGEPEVPGILSWAEMLAIGKKQSDEDLKKRLSLAAVNQCCSLIYTSGTTGPPKGVMLSQDQVTWGAKFYREFVDVKDTEGSIVSFLPLSHLAAQMADMYCSLHSVGVVNFSEPDALKGSLGKSLVEFQPKFFLAVPRVLEKIHEKVKEVAAESGSIKKSIGTWAKYHGLNYYSAIQDGRKLTVMELAKYNFAKALVFNRVKEAIGLRKARAILSVGAPLSTDVLEYFMSLDMPVFEGYGLSESLSMCSFSFVKEGYFRPGSVGKILPETEAILISADELRPGEGEICIKGRNICMGYLRMPEKTDEAIDDDGWLHTGDLGRFDDEGFLFITGRLKELVITAGGENIPPVLIEDVVKRLLPCVSNAMLIGDKRKYLTMLLTLKSEVDIDTMMPLDELTPLCLAWMREIGSQASTVREALQDIERNPKGNLARAIDNAIDKYNTDHSFSSAQKVQRWTFLPHDFSVPTEELNNVLKVKRYFVVRKYEDVIDKMYSDEL